MGRKVTLFLILLFALLVSCEKKYGRLVLITTGNVTSIGAKTALINGNVVDPGEGIKQHGHCWDNIDEPTYDGLQSTKLGAKNNTGLFSSQLTDLNPNTKYYIRAYATDGSNIVYGPVKSFSTQDLSVPIIQTGIVDNLTPTSASVKGTLVNLGNGIDIVSQHGHCWSTGTNPTVSDAKTELGTITDVGEFESSLPGLEDSTRYYVRAYAINEKGTAYGSVISFTTPGSLPHITDDQLEYLSQTSVKITTNLAYLGADNLVTNYGHCWALHDNPDLSDNTNDLGSTTSTGLFNSTLSDLIGGTIYYIRSYATNSYGTTFGPIIPFIPGDPALAFINDPNLVAYYPFNGNANDESNNSNDGTIVGTTWVQDRDGRNNSALSFDGDGDFVSCGSDNREIVDIITISLWLKTTDTYSYIISKYNLLTQQSGFILNLDPDGYLRFAGRDEDGAGGDYIRTSDPPSIINDGNWHHVIAIVNLTEWDLYIDGILAGTATSTTTSPLLTNGIDLTIASNPDIGTVPASELSGVIDDVLIFNRVLTTEEINILSGTKR